MISQSVWIQDAFVRTKCIGLKADGQDLVNYCREPDDKILEPQNIQSIVRYSRSLDQGAMEIIRMCRPQEMSNNAMIS